MSKTFWWVKLPGNFLPTHAASSLSVSEGVLLEPLDYSFAWLSLCMETTGMAVAQSQGCLD